MNKLVALAASLPLLACVVGPDTPTAPDGTGVNGEHGGGPGTGGGTGSGDNATHITASTTWSTYDVTKQTVIDPGVTVTIPAGAVVHFASGTAVDVRGTVLVQGTKDAPVNLSPKNAGEYHYGFSVATGGTLTMDYGVQVGGGITALGGAITVRDSKMSQSSGDFLVASSGSIDVSYSSIGLEVGPDTTHCDMHFDGNAPTIKVTHSNISTSSYGLMLYGGSNLDMTSNNWFKNSIQIDTTPGASADITGGWFDGATPKAGPGAMLIGTDKLATARLTDTGPR